MILYHSYICTELSFNKENIIEILNNFAVGFVIDLSVSEFSGTCERVSRAFMIYNILTISNYIVVSKILSFVDQLEGK